MITHILVINTLFATLLALPTTTATTAETYTTLQLADRMRLGDNSSIHQDIHAAIAIYRDIIHNRHQINNNTLYAHALNSLAEIDFFCEAADCLMHEDFESRFLEAAEFGNAAAQHNLAFLYAFGLGNQRDITKALTFEFFAAMGGSSLAKMSLGFRHIYGLDVPQSCTTALNYYVEVARKVVDLPIEGDFMAKQTGGLQTIDRMNMLRDQFKTDSPEDDDDVVDYYLSLADRGDASALVFVGHIYLLGAYGTEKDYAKALKYYLEAAAKDQRVANAQLGQIYLEGLGVEADNDTALEYFKKAAADGSGLGQFGLGYMFLYGYGVAVDVKRAVMHLDLASDAGIADAQFLLGNLYFTGEGVTQSFETSVKYWSYASNKNHIRAMFNLGQVYSNGIGVSQSCKAAVNLYKNVAERGLWSLAMNYANNEYKEGNYDKAIMRYGRLAVEGHLVAQINAGMMFQRQQGFDNESMAQTISFHMWRFAAAQGDPDSLRILGDFFYEGFVENGANYAKAVENYRTAADQRDPEALFNLGYMHQYGIGIEQDFHLAKRYYDEAIEMSDLAYVPCRLALGWLQIQWMYHSLFSTSSSKRSSPSDLNGLWKWIFAELLLEDIVLGLLIGVLGIIVFIRQHR